MTLIEKLDKYFRVANYISVGQLYLKDNPLLKRPLKKEDLKNKIVGHWGTVPGQNFIYTHLNRIIKEYDLDMIYISGPGHGGNFMVANTYIEGSFKEKYPNITMDCEGLKKLFKQFSYPGGIPSHVAPEVPGSIHEGGELGYSLSHAFGAVLDNPNLIAACVVGDGEAETGPLATSWHGIKFLNRKKDGVVLPILHLNGYKISNPTIFARMSNDEIACYFRGLGYKPYLVSGSENISMHKKMIATLDIVINDIKKIKEDDSALYPMIILKTPKGWTGPKVVDGKNIEGTFRAHQVPVQNDTLEHINIIEEWLKSYKPEELFDENGRVIEEIRSICPVGDKRLGSTPYANRGIKKELIIPDINNYKVDFNTPGEVKAQDMLVLSSFIKDIFKLNEKNANFRLFCPDETMSNRLYNVFDATSRTWQMEIKENDEYLSKDGRVMDSMLSEHMCEGMFEGYILTGRHGILTSYEAFIRIVDSMVSQHAKWLKMCKEINFRKDISSLNLILTSNVWQQDHNGYTHQDPGFLNHLVTKKSDIINIYLPPDANCLLWCLDKSLKTKNGVNAIVASKQPSYQWLTMEDAINHCENGVGIWKFVADSVDPDIVLVSCGDTPTIEMIAAVKILKNYLPNIKIRFINVVDLMRLSSTTNKKNALSDSEYDNLFTKDKPIIFAFHGYPNLIYELAYFRHNHNLSVLGYQEEGTITTSFDMRVRNKIDRFNLVKIAVSKLELGDTKDKIINDMDNKLREHSTYIVENGIDIEEIRNWKF